MEPSRINMYVLNNASKVAHIKPTTEICNVDQIKNKRESMIILTGYRICRHCAKR
jgi:hypothetical protein